MGIGNSLRLTVPIYCMRADDELIIQSVKYKSDEILIAADILRRPFLSPYKDPPRFEPSYCGQDVEFFDKNFDALNTPQGTPLAQLR
jgi:hypothetical protein